MTQPTAMIGKKAKWEHFPHEADIGVRGFGATPAEAFEQLRPHCDRNARSSQADRVSPDPLRSTNLELLFVEWLNAIIYEMAVRRMLFSRFAVRLEDTRLHGTLGGERVDVERHAPACEPKGATYTALKVAVDAEGLWSAAEEAPGAYKDVSGVVAAAEHAGLARRVARLRPLICIKG
jgi:SHS2 domain-containing protein